MRIAVLGDGAMGCLFGGYLSQNNDVTLVGIHPEKTAMILKNGVRIEEKNGVKTFHPHATTDASRIGGVELVVLFVKSMFNEDVLLKNRCLIGTDTFVLTFQNGCGHDQVISRFVPKDRIIIGTTQHNASLKDDGTVVHGGAGLSTIGLLEGESAVLQPMAMQFTTCGWETKASDGVMRDVWGKLFTNTSVSVLSAVLQCSLDYISQCPEAWVVAETLVKEAVAVAKADGYPFEEAEAVRSVRVVVDTARNGYTSICMDLKAGRKTEVEMISGYVVRRAGELGVDVPCQDMMVRMIHALEMKPRL